MISAVCDYDLFEPDLERKNRTAFFRKLIKQPQTLVHRNSYIVHHITMAKRKTTDSAVKNYGLLIDRNFRLIKQNYLKTFREIGSDITTEQWVVLDILSRQDGLSQNDLATLAYKNPPTLSRILDLMVKKNWLERRRSETDGRIWEIYLTEKGEQTHREILPHVAGLRTAGWAGLSEEDFAKFKEIMDRIWENNLLSR